MPASQTTGAMSGRNVVVEFSLDNATWTDISGHATSVKPSGGDRITDEEYTFAGDTALIRAGKREPVEVEFAFLYTQGVSEPFAVLKAAQKAGETSSVRWSYAGGQTGDTRYTVTDATIVNVAYPEAEASSAKPLPAMLKVKAADIGDEVVA